MIPSWAPNVHPMLIHFPIVLVMLAALVDVARLVRPHAGIGRLATGLYALGASAAVAAFLTGWLAARTVFTPGMAHGLVAEHRSWALVTTVAFVGVAAVRLSLQLLGRSESTTSRVLSAGVALALAVLVQQTAERGARLVYEQGVGVIQDHRGDRDAVPDGTEADTTPSR
jgi:uncharacterized membrane protein